MNFDQEITKLIEAIKADKSILQPWRNKAIARLEESQAFVRMGQNTAPQWLRDAPVGPDSTACTCPKGAFDKSCPIHGGV